jgi:hypothetical protein
VQNAPLAALSVAEGQNSMTAGNENHTELPFSGQEEHGGGYPA